MVDWVEIGYKINEAIIKEWTAQGHSLTGSLEASLRSQDAVKVTENGNVVTIEATANHYWKYINSGVQASQIRKPFAPARIAGLTNYMMLRAGLPLKEARGAAYAVATKHKREGMPQPFATRTKYVDKAFENSLPEMERVLDIEIGKTIDEYAKL